MLSEEQLQAYGYGPSDEYIKSQTAKGQKTYEKQRYGRPQFSFPDVSQSDVDRDRLLNVLMGASAGVRAAQGAESPFGAAAAGLGGGIQSFRAAQAQQQAAAIQRRQIEAQEAEDQLNMLPVGQVSPQMAKALQSKYGMDVSEIPMGQFQKFSGLLQHTNDLEKQLTLIQARALAKPEPVDKSAQAAIAKARTAAANARATVGSVSPELDRILKLNKNTRAGIVGEAKQKISSGLNIGQDVHEYKNTADVVNSLQSMVAKVLKSTFGGQLSDSERAYLQEVYGASARYTQAERAIAIESVRRMIRDKSVETDAALSELTGTMGRGSDSNDPLGIR